MRPTVSKKQIELFFARHLQNKKCFGSRVKTEDSGLSEAFSVGDMTTGKANDLSYII